VSRTLIEVANIVLPHFRSSKNWTGWGGDEFLVALPYSDSNHGYVQSPVASDGPALAQLSNVSGKLKLIEPPQSA